MKNVLVLMHDDVGQEARFQAALDLTRALDGHLTCLDVAILPVTVDDYAMLGGAALLVADEPEFAGAVTNALLGRDPDVEVLRQRIGREIRDRLSNALGPDVDADVIDSLEMLYSGALVRAGMGYTSYQEIAQRLEKSARLMLG